MKKLLTLIVVALAMISISASADYTTNKTSVISVDPLDLINAGRINAIYETKFGNANNSLTINGSYWSWSEYGSAIGAGVSYRWYLDPFKEGKKALNGLSLGPRLDYYYWTWDFFAGYSDYSYSTLAIGGEVNYKWVFDNQWVVEPNIKFGIPILKESGGSYTSYGFGLNLGYAF